MRPQTRVDSRLRLAALFKLVGGNILVFFLIFMVLEIAHRSYASIVNGRSFFRQNTFTSPWITTLDYPPPKIGPDGQAYFRHRADPTPVEKPEGTFRIIAVGGSTTANEKSFAMSGVDYPLSLEGKLSNGLPGIRVEVLNAGGSAYSTAQSLINIEFRLIEFRPDIIVLMHNINDSSVNFFDDGATFDYANKYMKSYFLSPSLQGSLSVRGFLTQSRFLAKYILPRMFVSEHHDFNPDADHSKGLRYFRRNIASIAAICRQNRVELVLLSQPYSMEPNAFVSETAFFAYDQAIEEIAIEYELDFIDMFSEFGHDESLFLDEFHYSPVGIEKFTDILFFELQSRIEDALRQEIPSMAHESEISGIEGEFECDLTRTRRVP
jgi:hypothetical protein